MSAPRRIYSLETEYALMQEGGGRPFDLYERIEAVLSARHATVSCDTVGPRSAASRGAGIVELKEGLFIDTGARVYYDTGHLEWACPESDSAADATVWDSAADRELEEAARAAAEMASPATQASRIMVIKNNVDYAGLTTYGCHENYSVRRLAAPRDALVAFLVTRTILCGAGRWGAATGGPDDAVAFQISQRADFIEEVASKDTRDSRPILNERDEPLADPRQYRRLHLILGDSNLSAWSNLMKLGTTGLVLDALEQGAVPAPPVLRTPVGALREVSRDLAGVRSYALQDGGRATAAQIQRWYWRASADALAGAPPDDPRWHILRLWAEALDDFEADPARLHDRADWRVKHHFFEREVFPRLGTSWDEIGAWDWVVGSTAREVPPPGADPERWLELRLSRAEAAALRDVMRQRRLDWREYPRQRKNYYALRALDVRFHDLDRRHGFFYQRPTRASLPGVTVQAVETARREPPRRTRAWLRGRILKSAHRQSLASLDWDRVYLTDGRSIALPDPFKTYVPELGELFRLAPEEQSRSWHT